MASDIDNTFGGRVTFHMLAECLYTEGKRKALYNQIKAKLPNFDSYNEGDIFECTLILSCTESIDFNFNERERKALKLFREFWSGYQQLDAETLVKSWMTLHTDILNAWRREWNDGQELFDVDPAEKPTSSLTPEQQKEAADPTSPLA